MDSQRRKTMSNLIPTKAPKTARINVRTTTRQEDLIRRAAEATDRSVTDFVLASASTAAEKVLADRKWFPVSSEQWEAFEALLDKPLPETGKLLKLAATPSPFSS